MSLCMSLSMVHWPDKHVICIDNSSEWRSSTDFDKVRAYPDLILKLNDNYIFLHFYNLKSVSALNRLQNLLE